MEAIWPDACGREMRRRYRSLMKAVSRRPRDAGDIRHPCTSRALNEGSVERDKLSIWRPATQVHRVGKLDSVCRQRKRRSYRRFVLGLNIFQTEQLRECVPNGAFLKSVQTAEHPACFEQNRLRDPD